MGRGEEFSSFRSAVEWPIFQSDFDEQGELAHSLETDTWISLGSAFAAVVESTEIAIEVAPRCESPIEIDLAVRLTKAIRAIDDPTLTLGHQFQLGRYRYDLSIMREGRKKPLALVECDGKEFHSSVEQAANDRAKDVLAAKEGIQLFRFTGSEIYRDIKSCVRLIMLRLRFSARLSQRDWDALELARMV